MQKIELGLIGYGYWGPNFARLISKSNICSLKYCADLITSSLAKVKEKYPQVITTNNYHDILKDKEVLAVLIITPVKSHFTLAYDALKAYKHVFVEKPLTFNIQDSKKLISLANKNKRILMTGHTFLYNPAVRYIKNLIGKNELGNIKHLHFQRCNLGPIRKDVNVLWDLAAHDISMLLYLIKDTPEYAIAIGEAFLQNNVHDVVSASIKFKGGIIANMILSWIDPVKTRDITIVGDKKMLVFDDVEIKDKVKVYDKNVNIINQTKSVSFQNYQIALHNGITHIPTIVNKEPLKEELNHFIDCIQHHKKPLTDGTNGLEVVRILTALQKSLENNSKLIKL